jgi:regulatory protein
VTADPGPRRPTRGSRAERQARRAAVDDPEVVLAAAFRFLEARARSVVETRRRLTEAGYRAELIEGALDRLRQIGLLDDEAFARGWIESRDRARPRGEIALRRELRLRGVESEAVEAALEERRAETLAGAPAYGVEADSDTPGDPDEAAARRLLGRRRRDLERVAEPGKRRQRAYALLARSGFAPDVAARVAAESLEPSASGADEDGEIDPGAPLGG